MFKPVSLYPPGLGLGLYYVTGVWLACRVGVAVDAPVPASLMVGVWV